LFSAELISLLSAELIALLSAELITLRLAPLALFFRRESATLRLRLVLKSRRATRSQWRILPQPATLAGRQTLRRRHPIHRADGPRGFSQRLASEFGPPSLPEFSDFLTANLVGAGNARRSGEHNRPHVESMNGAPDERRHHIRLNTRIDRVTIIAEVVGSVHDHCLWEEHIIIAQWHNYPGDVRRNEVARPAENPIVGLTGVIDDDLLRR
jgi:hypothetical protein